MRITMEFEVPAAVALQIAQLAATHTAEPIPVADGPWQPQVNAEPAGPTESESQVADDDGLPLGWTREKLVRYYAEINDAQRGLLDYLAANTGKWVGSEELADNVAGINSSKSIAGIVGGMGRRAKRHGASQLPFDWRKIKGLWHQRMPAAVADVIREASA
jgi:Family of unknown function (DUF6416)